MIHETRAMLLAGSLALCAVSMPVTAAAQGATRPPRAARAAKPYTLNVKASDGFVTLTVKTVNVSLATLAADLSTQLHAKVNVSQSLEKDLLTLDFTDAPLEGAIVSFAPRVLIDYEVRRDRRPAVQAIHLLAAVDENPPANTTDKGSSMGLMIEGNTEDSTDPKAEDPLKISGDRNGLTASVKKQRLSTVAMALGDILGVPVDLSYDSAEMVDAEFSNLPAEDAVTTLSPSLTLLVRADLNLADRRPLRLSVTAPNR